MPLLVGVVIGYVIGRVVEALREPPRPFLDHEEEVSKVVYLDQRRT